MSMVFWVLWELSLAGIWWSDLLAAEGDGAAPDADSENKTSTTKPLNAVGGLFEGVDRGMVLRMTYVLMGLTFLIAVYFGIKIWRMRRKERVRHYDTLSAKQLQPELVVDSESEDELFDSADPQARLVKPES